MATIFFRRIDLNHKTHLNTDQRISEDSVSCKNYFINTSYILADKPFMEPRKDYDDYSRFINDTYVEEIHEMLN